MESGVCPPTTGTAWEERKKKNKKNGEGRSGCSATFGLRNSKSIRERKSEGWDRARLGCHYKPQYMQRLLFDVKCPSHFTSLSPL